ncbi:MAG: lysophospholipid acyltransferase family protein [Oscillospiraceae bacterium]
MRKGFLKHLIIYILLWLPATLYARIKFRFSPKMAPRIAGPFLLVSNHNSAYDMLMVAASFFRHMYFVAGEHIFRFGFSSKLIEWAFAPISKTKGTTDSTSAINVIKTLKKGRNVCIFAEGNCSFNGVTGRLHPTTGRLAKMSGVTLVTYRLEGVYLAKPRWSIYFRYGRTSGSVVNVYSPETLRKMTAEEIDAAIAKDVYENAFQRQREYPVRFRGRALAEKLEEALYICPACGGLATLSSRENEFSCTCGFSVRYGEYGFFNKGAPFETVYDWDRWQGEKLREVSDAYGEGAVFTDGGQMLYSISSDHSEELAAEGKLTMYNDRIEIGDFKVRLDDIAQMAIVLKQNIVFTALGKNYEIRSGHYRSGRKYLSLFNYRKNAVSAVRK